MKRVFCFLSFVLVLNSITAYPDLPLRISNNFETDYPTNTYYHSDKMVDIGDFIWAVFNDTIVVKINKKTGISTFAPFEMPRCAWQENLEESYRTENNKEWILALQKDKENNLYIGGSWRISKFDGNNLTDIVHAKDFPWPPMQIFCYSEMAFDEDNTCYAAGNFDFTYNLLINKNGNNSLKQVTGVYNMNSMAQETVGLGFDSKGDIWFATNHYGCSTLNLLKKGSDTAEQKFKLDTKNAEYEHTFLSMTIDKNDNIWLTSRHDGIFCYSSATNTMHNYTAENHSEISGTIFFCSTQKDDNGNIWFCSDSMLMKYDGTHFSTYECTEIKNVICMLCVNDTIWLYRNDKKITRFTANGICTTYPLNPEETSIEGALETSSNNPELFIFYSNNLLTIRNYDAIGDFAIFDIAGKKLVAETCKENNYFMPIALSKGIYIIKTKNENRKIVVK